MNNGLYGFEIAGQVEGVVVLRDGRIQGGDKIVYFVGSYNFEGNRTVRADVTVRRHSSGMSWLPIGADQLVLTVTGTFDCNTADLRAAFVDVLPATPFRLRLRRIAH